MTDNDIRDMLINRVAELITKVTELDERLAKLENLVDEGHKIMMGGFDVQSVHVPKPGTLYSEKLKT